MKITFTRTRNISIKRLGTYINKHITEDTSSKPLEEKISKLVRFYIYDLGVSVNSKNYDNGEEIINTIIEAMKADGTFEAVKTKYDEYMKIYNLGYAHGKYGR